MRIAKVTQPVALAQPRGESGRLFIVQSNGLVRLIIGGRLQARPFLDVRSRISCCGEQGLLGLAFDPQYRRNGLLYVSYTDRSGNSRIIEYRRSASDANRADPRSARTVLGQAQPEGNHNGGNIVFGPDGLLYFGLGDGGGQGDQHGALGNAQNLGTLLGKIIRINPHRSGSRQYTVPADNPFVGRLGARPEIWSYGLRNPWRFSFDRGGGGLVIGDVGQNSIEEVDWAPAPGYGRGANYGWRPFEGTSVHAPGESAPGAIPPVAQYPHGAGGECSVTGGYVVRDPRLAGLAGRYLFGDFCSGRIWSAELRAGSLAATVSSPLPFTIGGLSSFGEDQAGRIYAMSYISGSVYRLDPN